VKPYKPIILLLISKLISCFLACRWWQMFLVVLVFYTAWVSPFEFGFLKEPLRPLSVTDNVVNIIFFFDIWLTFFVAYYDKTTYLLVDRHGPIARRYLKTWFLFDLVSTIPYELTDRLFPTLDTYGYFGMLRLWRLRRVSAMFARSVPLVIREKGL